ncbi:hypothetical protein C121_88 [Stenotrophomonas phage C121]|uniref:hypothetical protein n=1 Tax=Stenotrophomonas phage C121 TaxID=2914029 RepID=UPI00232947F9|nr:hypothetical protein PP752_gp88 [Stenotrophomonas phage C121]UKL14821.1 hypothetical protein C121_88 [Stenotrophomonas phage C121]
MSLIIRAETDIANPLPGSLIVPEFGVTGLIMRHAPSADFKLGQSVSQVSDMAGSRPLVASGGTTTMTMVDGRLAATIGAANGKLSTSNAPHANGIRRSQAVLVYLPSTTPGVRQFAGTIDTGTSLQLCMAIVGSPYRVGAYGNGATYPQLAMTGGWHRIITTFSDDGTGAVAVDGVIQRGTLQFTGDASNLLGQLKSVSDYVVSFIDHAVFDHALSDAEIAKVDGALARWLV